MPLSRNRPRLTVIGIDGVPHSLLRMLIDSGVTPNLRRIADHNTMIRQKSVLPTVSSAAWTSFMTGLYPARHGISGFIIKEPDSYDVRIPDSSSINGETLQQVASNAGNRIFSMGVPVTSPPIQINGVMIGCFLSTDLDRVVWPPAEIRHLKELRYCIDPDPRIAHSDRSHFMELLTDSLEARFATIRYYMERDPWDLFIAHVMETDRLNHFFWDDYRDSTYHFHDAFFEFYRRLDTLIGQMTNDLQACEDLIILSDHGFCRLEYEVNVAKWLIENGLCSVTSSQPGLPLAHIDWASTRVYNLIPGRIYVNVRGREPGGIVDQSSKRTVLENLKESLLLWKSPCGKSVLDDVLLEEEIPGGASGYRAPDALLVPSDGMDLKDGAGRPEVFERKILSGMHTYDDALLIYPERCTDARAIWIGDLQPSICERLGLPVPRNLDGRKLPRGS